MLKRQRSSSSFVPVACPSESPEPPIDMYERMAKRRRQMAPPHISGGGKGKEFLRAGDSEAEEDVESSDQAAASGQAVSEQAQRLEQAGEYKHVNTLLHDLHAEQRHRMLFSTSSPPSSNPVFHHFTVYPEPGHPFPSQTSKSDLPEFTLYPSNSPLPSKHTSFTINIPSKAPETMNDAETECVTHRYEDTNRLLRSLFLSRRKSQWSEDT